MVLVSLQNVSFTYEYADLPALTNVSLELESGLVYGVVGLNSSGKSTLCSLIRGLIPAFHQGELSGTVTVLGKDLAEWEPADLSRSIGYVFQNPFTQISGIRDTVFEEIALGLENLGVERDEMIERVLEVVEQLGIESIIAKNPNDLSGGQRQKVAFAAIIAMDADFIVIDEPTSQLDPDASDAVFGIIRTLKEQGKSIILVEHKMDLLAEFADRLIVMHEGTVVLEGDVRTVLLSGVLDQVGVPRPEVTELARRLDAIGRPLDTMPITRAEAHEALSRQLMEESYVDHAH